MSILGKLFGNSNTPGALLSKARKAERNSNTQEALNLYNEVLKLFPNSSEAGQARIDASEIAKKQSGKQASTSESGSIEFDANGKVMRVNMKAGRWEEKRSGQSRYCSQRGRSLLYATETLKAVSSIPEETYYVVETPDGTLGRDMFGFYTESPIKTSALRLETSARVRDPVESVSLTAFGDARNSQVSVAQLKSAGQYAAFVLLLECGHCGYKSPVETVAGDFARQCYACGATNKSHRANIDVLLGTRMVQI